MKKNKSIFLLIVLKSDYFRIEIILECLLEVEILGVKIRLF